MFARIILLKIGRLWRVLLVYDFRLRSVLSDLVKHVKLATRKFNADFS